MSDVLEEVVRTEKVTAGQDVVSGYYKVVATHYTTKSLQYGSVALEEVKPRWKAQLLAVSTRL